MNLRLVIWCAVAAVALFSPVMLDAHEIGTTRVAVTFNNASYDIEIVTDAAALVEKLESVSGIAARGRSAADLQDFLRNYDDAFRNRIAASFDGTSVRPSIEYSVSGTSTPTSSPVAVIKLSGPFPHGAKQLEWSYAWTFSTYSLTVTADGNTQTTQWLEGGQASGPIQLTPTPKPPLRRAAVATQYLALGFTHIVPKGLDHMLFVLGIFLLDRRFRRILGQVSAFTIAHSITLALSVYGIVSVPARIVEPLIAISIAYVALENIFMSELKPWRAALVFAFGLLHGLGFAGALHELGMPRSEFVTALLTFNLGVEAGQLAVIGAAFLLVGWYWDNRQRYRRFVVMPVSALIACTGIYWTFERLSLL